MNIAHTFGAAERAELVQRTRSVASPTSLNIKDVGLIPLSGFDLKGKKISLVERTRREEQACYCGMCAVEGLLSVPRAWSGGVSRKVV